jgi:hypothetical protein
MDGTPGLGYALCMETSIEKVPWLLETFWGQGSKTFIETITGVGYHSTGKGRVGFFSLDVDKGDAAVEQFLLELTGQTFTLAKPAAPESKEATATETASVVLPDSDELETASITTIETDAGENVTETITPSSLTKSQLQALCDERGITFRKKDNIAQLVSLLS